MISSRMVPVLNVVKTIYALSGALGVTEWEAYRDRAAFLGSLSGAVRSSGLLVESLSPSLLPLGNHADEERDAEEHCHAGKEERHALRFAIPTWITTAAPPRVRGCEDADRERNRRSPTPVT